MFIQLFHRHISFSPNFCTFIKYFLYTPCWSFCLHDSFRDQLCDTLCPRNWSLHWLQVNHSDPKRKGAPARNQLSAWERLGVCFPQLLLATLQGDSGCAFCSEALPTRRSCSHKYRFCQFLTTSPPRVAQGDWELLTIAGPWVRPYDLLLFSAWDSWSKSKLTFSSCFCIPFHNSHFLFPACAHVFCNNLEICM